MAKYLLKRNLLIKPETGEQAEAGTIVEIADQEFAQKLLDRGTIVEVGEGVEFTPPKSAFETAQDETEERNAVATQALTDQSAREAEAQTAIEERKEQLNVAPVAPTAPENQQAVAAVDLDHQPTQEEIEATLKAAEDSSQSSVEIQ